MRVLSYTTTSDDRVARPGVLTADGSGVVDVMTHRPTLASVDQIIEEGQLNDLAELATYDPHHQLSDVTLERPLTWPKKIFCIGVNYGGRSAEYADTSDAAYPSVFVRFPDSFTGHGQPLIRPPESPQLDYEGEIVVVIGAEGRRIPVDRARSHIAAVTLGNEGTIRDWVRHAKFNVTQGKNWEATGAIGPWLVPIDEIPPFDDLEITTHVNGELRQSDSPRTMKYTIEYQIHYLSTFTTLRPGDIIFTGTPTGAGARFDPPIWLQPGDQIDITVDGIGTLSNSVADEFPDGSQLEAPAPQ